MNCWCGEMADTIGLEPIAVGVRVQVSPPAPRLVS